MGATVAALTYEYFIALVVVVVETNVAPDRLLVVVVFIPNSLVHHYFLVERVSNLLICNLCPLLAVSLLLLPLAPLWILCKYQLLMHVVSDLGYSSLRFADRWALRVNN